MCIHVKRQYIAFIIIVRRFKKLEYNIGITPEKNYSRGTERTICIRITDCLLNQVRFKCFCHQAQIY